MGSCTAHIARIRRAYRSSLQCAVRTIHIHLGITQSMRKTGASRGSHTQSMHKQAKNLRAGASSQLPLCCSQDQQPEQPGGPFSPLTRSGHEAHLLACHPDRPRCVPRLHCFSLTRSVLDIRGPNSDSSTAGSSFLTSSLPGRNLP